MTRSPARLLWFVLAVGLVLNVTGSTGMLPLPVGLAGGGVVALAVVGLVSVRRRSGSAAGTRCGRRR